MLFWEINGNYGYDIVEINRKGIIFSEKFDENNGYALSQNYVVIYIIMW